MIADQHLDYLFPAICVVILVALLIRALCTFTKTSPESLIGISPRIRPFETREEYLKARLEMDLETFLERASVTPTHVKGKTEGLADREPGRVDVTIKKVSGAGFRPPADIQGFPGYVYGAGGSAGSSVTGMAGGIRGDAGHPGAAGIPGIGGECDGIHIKVGAWYRTKRTGELLHLSEHRGNIGWFNGKDGIGRYAFYRDVELAIPRCGESWEMKPCAMHGETACKFIQTNRDRIVTEFLKASLLCGCLVPYEFGLGLAGERFL